MIKVGFAISAKDSIELKEFKNSAAYGTYLKAISSSPAFTTIMNEHINNIDITEDVKSLKTQGKIPDSVSPKALSDLFKQSLARMAICIAADSIILKELEDLKLDEVMNNIKKDSDLLYLLGKADKKYYEQAKRMLEKGKLDKDSIAFRGLAMYLKQNGEIKFDSGPRMIPDKIQEPIPSKAKPAAGIDFDSSNIQL